MAMNAVTPNPHIYAQFQDCSKTKYGGFGLEKTIYALAPFVLKGKQITRVP